MRSPLALRQRKPWARSSRVPSKPHAERKAGTAFGHGPPPLPVFCRRVPERGGHIFVLSGMEREATAPVFL